MRGLAPRCGGQAPLNSARSVSKATEKFEDSLDDIQQELENLPDALEDSSEDVPDHPEGEGNTPQDSSPKACPCRPGRISPSRSITEFHDPSKRVHPSIKRFYAKSYCTLFSLFLKQNNRI